MIVRELFAKLGFQVDQRSVAQANSTIDRMRQRLSGLTGNIRVFGSAVGGRGGAADGIGRLAAGFLGLHAAMRLGGGLMTTLVEFERLKAQLTTIVGSAEAADQSLRFIQRFARQTPFDVEQTVGAFMRLRQGGIEPTEARLTSLGNVAAAFSGDIGRLVEAAINTSRGAPRLLESILRTDIDLLSAPGKVRLMIGGVRHEIERSTPAIIAFLETLGETQFGGAMSRMMGTLVGATANLRDAAVATAWQIGDGGLTAALVRLFQTVVNTTDKSQDMARALGRELGRAVDRLTEVIRFLSQHTEELRRAFVILGGFAVSSAIMRLARLFSLVLSPVRALQLALLMIPILVQDFVGFLRGDDSLITRILGKERAGDVREFFAGLSGPLDELWGNIKDLAESILGVVGRVFEALFGTDRETQLNTVKGAITGTLELLNKTIPILTQIADIIGGIVSGIRWVYDTFFGGASVASEVENLVSQGLRDLSPSITARLPENLQQQVAQVQGGMPLWLARRDAGANLLGEGDVRQLVLQITQHQNFGPAAATPERVSRAGSQGVNAAVERLQRETWAAARGVWGG